MQEEYAASKLKGTIDFAIVTIKPGELGAVLERFPPIAGVRGRRRYSLTDARRLFAAG